DGHGGTATGTVTISIDSVNDPPVANNGAATTDEDTPVSINVLANDTDADLGTTLTAAIVTNPSHGTVSVNAASVITYTPAPNYNGSDSFTYKANDGIVDSNVATVSITIAAVNDAPVAGNDTATTAEDTPVTIGVLANDSDADGDPLTITATTPAAHGTATSLPDGTITYAPALNYNGGDSFTYTISDGHGGTATATVNVTVTAVNDAPSAANTSFSVAEDDELYVPTPGVLTGAGDVDSASLTAVKLTDPSHGSVM